MKSQSLYFALIFCAVFFSVAKAQPPINYNPMGMDICRLKPNCCPTGGRVECNTEVFATKLDEIRGGKTRREQIMSDSRNCATRIKATTLAQTGPAGLFDQFEASCVEPYCENTVMGLEELYKDSCCTCQDIKRLFGHLPLNRLVGTCDDLPAYWMCHHLGRCFDTHYNYTVTWCEQCGYEQVTRKMFYEKSMYSECAVNRRKTEKAEQEAKIKTGGRRELRREFSGRYVSHSPSASRSNAPSHLLLGTIAFLGSTVVTLLVMITGIIFQTPRKRRIRHTVLQL